MILFLLRHGKADWPDWEGADDERPLNEEGIREMRVVAAAFKRLKMPPDLIISSPLPRALKTAEIVGEELDVWLINTRFWGRGSIDGNVTHCLGATPGPT